MSDDAEMRARVALMALGFKSKLPARFEKMNAAFGQCTLDGASDEHWTELHRLLHSLNGAAGTFGLAELGAQACVIEHTIKERLASGQWQAGDLDAIGAALQQLQSDSTT
ncbi:MAG: Hpt domain-containing protein [Pseudomonadota bacterium]